MTIKANLLTPICALLVAGATTGLVSAQAKEKDKPKAKEAVAVKDTLIKRNGERLRGVEIVELTTESVKYKRAGVEASMPASQLLQVEWSDLPDAFELARSAQLKGDAEAAANFYQEAGTKAVEAGRKLFEVECKFLAGRALALGMGGDGGKAKAAATALQGYLDAAPNGFRTPEAMLLQIRAQRVGADHPAAEANIKKFEEASSKQAWGLSWDARVKLEKAQLLLAQSKPSDARSAFQGVKSAVDAALPTAVDNDKAELEALRMIAVVSEGETFLRESKLTEAAQYFGQLASGGKGDIRAAALAGQAHAEFLQLAGKPDPKVLRSLQLKLAEAILLDTMSGDTTAKALYLQGKVLLALGPQAEAESYKQRARDYFDSVVRSYGSSIWANDARSELGK